MGVRMVFFDCDGVLTDNDSSWRVLHEYFGSGDNSYFAELYRRGIISYLDWMKIDIALMIHSYGRPIKRHDVEEALRDIRIVDEARIVFEELRRRGLFLGVVSSGVDILVKRVCRELRPDICLYNELLFIGDELIPGGNPRVPLHEKPAIIEGIAARMGVSLGEVAYVGDSSWDEPVFKRVGLGIALRKYGTRCVSAKEYIDSLAELPSILERY